MPTVRQLMPVLAATLFCAACAPDTDDRASAAAGGAALPASPASAAGTRPAGKPALVSVEGRILAGPDCLMLVTADERSFALTPGAHGSHIGRAARIKGEVADTHLCEAGEATLIVTGVTYLDE